MDGKTNIWVREKTKITDLVQIVRKRKWAWSAEYDLTDGYLISPSGNLTKRSNTVEDR